VLFICLFIRTSDTQITIAGFPNNEVVKLTFVELPPLKTVMPLMPSSKKKQIATKQYNNIDVVPDATTVPELSQLDNIQIGTIIQAGELSATQTPSNISIENENMNPQTTAPIEKNFDLVERKPEFPGGAQAWIAFLNKHLQAPDELNAGERKTTLVRFLVSEDGSIMSFEILQSAGSAFDNEVIRVLKKMPKWKPAVQKGGVLL
jgi:protein TonB